MSFSAFNRRNARFSASQTVQEYCALATIPDPHYYPARPSIPEGCTPRNVPCTQRLDTTRLVLVHKFEQEYFASRVGELLGICGSKPIRQDLMNSSNRAARLSASRRRGSLGQDIISDIKSGIIPRLEQVINDASSEGDRWKLQVVPEDSDPLKGFHTLTWTHPSGRKNIWYENCDNRIFNVYAIEPWSHTVEDLQRFQAKRGFHPSRIPSMKLLEDFPWGWEEELWAELYSRCWATNARWFVVTTYDNWIFGVFSETWESAAITAIHPYTSKQPNIIECLFFWLFSAMHQDRWDWAYKIPEVSTDSTATLTTSDLRTENNLPPDVRKIFGPTEQEQEQVFRLTRLCNIAKPTQDPPSGRPTRVLTVDLWRKPMDLKNLLAPHPYAEFIATLHEKEARIRRWRLGQLGFTDDAKIRNEVRDEDEDSMVIDG